MLGERKKKKRVLFSMHRQADLAHRFPSCSDVISSIFPCLNHDASEPASKEDIFINATYFYIETKMGLKDSQHLTEIIGFGSK